MCIFSSKVESVSKTEIFARRSAINKQFLVYRMDYEANQELAMILPLPTPPMSPEDAVRFIDLSGYPDFFKDMDSGFVPLTTIDSMSKGISRGISRSILEVQEVGNFEASFVPSLKDFDRLDPRFCLPKATWNSLPTYHDYGFTVFKLKPGNIAAHAMAFEFPTRFRSTLFFPTVHVHNNKEFELTANFDHSLYFQSQDSTANAENVNWVVSESLSGGRNAFARSFMDVDKTKGIVDEEKAIYRQSIKGYNYNVDTFAMDVSAKVS